MPEDLVSVIVPTFNRAYVLPRAVTSALRQTHTSVEVIIIDDGSTDGTATLVEDLWRREPRVRLVRTANQGVASARNQGIREARGAWVAFLDSDDEWLPWKIEMQVACLKALPDAGMIWTDMEGVGPDGERHPRYLRTMYSAWGARRCEHLFATSIPVRLPAPAGQGAVPAGPREVLAWVGNIYSAMIRGSLVHTSTVLLRRDCLQKVGLFDESLRPIGEDYDFHLRTCREGPVAFVDIVSIRYQLGLADRLTRPEYHLALARAFLTTISRACEVDSDRISLSRREIGDVFAEAHAWIGEAALDANDRALARKHFPISLRHRPAQPTVIRGLVKAYLPSPVLAAAKALALWLSDSLTWLTQL
jgi:GT2 family glycosyltransferase